MQSHQAILKPIRELLKNEFGQVYGGLIAFYCRSKNPSKDSLNLSVHVYPINEDIVKSHKFKESNREYEFDKYFNIIKNTGFERNYADLMHADYFQKHSKSIKHHFFSIPIKSVSELPWCDQCRKEVKTHDSYIKVLQDNKCCREGFKDIIESSDKIGSLDYRKVVNSLDNFFFKSIPKKFIFLPLPFFTAPSILLVLPYWYPDFNSDVNRNINQHINSNYDIWEEINSIRIRSKHLIYQYVFNELIKVLSTRINNKVLNISSEEDLIKEFVNELGDVLLYKRARINDEVVDQGINWSDKVKMYNLNIKFGNNDITFDIPTFVLKEINNSKNLYLNQTHGYKVEEELSIQLLQNVYTHIYSLWDSTFQMADNIRLKVSDQEKIEMQNIVRKWEDKAHTRIWQARSTYQEDCLKELSVYVTPKEEMLSMFAGQIDSNVFDKIHDPGNHKDTVFLETYLKGRDCEFFVENISKVYKMEDTFFNFDDCSDRKSVYIAKQISKGHLPYYWLHLVLERDISYESNYNVSLKFNGDGAVNYIIMLRRKTEWIKKCQVEDGVLFLLFEIPKEKFKKFKDLENLKRIIIQLYDTQHRVDAIKTGGFTTRYFDVLINTQRSIVHSLKDDDIQIKGNVLSYTLQHTVFKYPHLGS